MTGTAPSLASRIAALRAECERRLSASQGYISTYIIWHRQELRAISEMLDLADRSDLTWWDNLIFATGIVEIAECALEVKR